jgi:HK97 family phage major capsid protein
MSVSSAQVRSALLARMESRLSDMPTEAGSRFERTIRSLVNGAMGTDHEWQARQWQQRLLVRASAEYARAWSKYVSGQSFAITPEEARAIAVGTSTSGGYLVPTQLDPTVILTNDGATDVVRELVAARGGVRTMLPGTGNQWNGITSAGVTASWDAEGSAVSDDSPEFDKEGIPIKSARAWVEATFQSLINISGLESDLYGMFADAKNRLESATHCTGAGSSTVPEGIVTALVAATTRQIVSTTAAEIGVVDINKVHRTLGQRWRGRGSWLMNPLYADAIQALGTDVGVAYSGSIVGDYASTLKNRPWRVSDDMPDTQTTNTKDPEVIFGDWAGYVIVDRPGTMAVEFVPNVMDPSTGRPISTRGWLCWWEEGAGLFTPESFLMLVDKTTT